MFDNGYFFYFSLIAVICAVGVKIYLYFRYESSAEQTEIDKAVQRFKLGSFCFAVILYFGALFALDWIYIPTIYPDDPQATINEQLIENQEKIKDNLIDLRNFLFVVGIVGGMYIYAVGKFVEKLNDLRTGKSPDNDNDDDDHINKKPLGLE